MNFRERSNPCNELECNLYTVEIDFRAAVPTYSSTMDVIMYMYSVQSPAIKAVLCIEIFILKNHKL
jgi:hypothetical protein